jgi:hypothetical protein
MALIALLDYAVLFSRLSLTKSGLTTIYQQLLHYGYRLFIIYEHNWSCASAVLCGATSYTEVLHKQRCPAAEK